jgi:hypothetical protein
VTFSDKVLSTFKYPDYFSSVGRTTSQPMCLKGSDVDEIIDNCHFWEQKEIDTSKILDNCPFRKNE